MCNASLTFSWIGVEALSSTFGRMADFQVSLLVHASLCSLTHISRLHFPLPFIRSFRRSTLISISWWSDFLTQIRVLGTGWQAEVVEWIEPLHLCIQEALPVMCWYCDHTLWYPSELGSVDVGKSVDNSSMVTDWFFVCLYLCISFVTVA